MCHSLFVRLREMSVRCDSGWGGASLRSSAFGGGVCSPAGLIRARARARVISNKSPLSGGPAVWAAGQ